MGFRGATLMEREQIYVAPVSGTMCSMLSALSLHVHVDCNLSECWFTFDPQKL